LVIKDVSTTYRKGHYFKANTVYCPSFYRQLVTLMRCNIDNERTLTSLYIFKEHYCHVQSIETFSKIDTVKFC